MTPDQEINHAKFRLQYHDLSETDRIGFMDHDNDSIKAAAIRHPTATVEMLNKGLEDPDWYVKSVAEQQLDKRSLK